MVGTSGLLGQRWALVMANARSLPASTCGIIVCTESKAIETCPENKSISAGAIPLYGTWVRFRFAVLPNCSATKWAPEPMPLEAKVALLGLLFAHSMYWARLVGDSCALETMRRGMCPNKL